MSTAPGTWLAIRNFFQKEFVGLSGLVRPLGAGTGSMLLTETGAKRGGKPSPNGWSPHEPGACATSAASTSSGRVLLHDARHKGKREASAMAVAKMGQPRTGRKRHQWGRRGEDAGKKNQRIVVMRPRANAKPGPGSVKRVSRKREYVTPAPLHGQSVLDSCRRASFASDF